ncbi:MAG: DUF5076 domain-containing protein [Gemmataceae bacterium]
MSAPSEPPEGAIDLVRAWLANGALDCTVRPLIFEDPSAWGSVFAELAKYVVLGLHEHEQRDQNETLTSIRDVFNRDIQAALENLT